MEGPIFLKRNEYKSLVKLLNNPFPHNAPFDKTLSHIGNTLEKDLKHHLIIKEKGKVVSHVGIFPQKAIIGNSVINIVEIGGVSTVISNWR